jgi:hypothetical protein
MKTPQERQAEWIAAGRPDEMPWQLKILTAEEIKEIDEWNDEDE